MRILLSSVLGKYAVWVLVGVLVYGPFDQVVLSQEVTAAFKITGPKKIEIYPGSTNQKAVEYDPSSPDHLFVSYFGLNGVLLEKDQFLFLGKSLAWQICRITC